MLDQQAICEALGVDAYGLERLIETEGLTASGEVGARQIEPKTLDQFKTQRLRNRSEALTALAKLDGSHV
jgi:hypothetical protein